MKKLKVKVCLEICVSLVNLLFVRQSQISVE
jgi:hypothetical protein